MEKRRSWKMEVLTLLLLTLPSSWSMPSQWSEWSKVESPDVDDSPGTVGEFVDDLIYGDYTDDLIDVIPNGVGPAAPSPGFFGLGALGGGAALATIAGIAASTGLAFKLGWTKAAAGGLLVKNKDQTSDVLRPGDRLEKMEWLLSENGEFQLLLEEGGNLVISGTQEGIAVWSTKTAGAGNTYFRFKEDGDLVVVNGADVVIWNSGTEGLGGNQLQMTNEGFLVLSGSNNQQIWRSRPHTLITGQSLSAGDSMTSSNENFHLRIQEGADLGVYWLSGDDSAAIWRAEVSGASYLKLQGDGNLVLYSSVDEVLWESKTKGSKARSLVLNNDGKLTLCCNKDGSAIWSNVDDDKKRQQPKSSVLTKLDQSLLKVGIPLQMMVMQHMDMNKKISPPKNFDDLMSDLETSKMINPAVVQSLREGSPLEMVIQDMKPEQMTAQAMNVGDLISDHLDSELKVGWSVWSEFSACSATCGTATKMRERVCADTAKDETMCQGPSAEIFNCNLPVCGGWSAWSDVIQCSATCGPAVKTRARTCTDDSNGGINCLGSSEETIDCGLVDCPEVLEVPAIYGFMDRQPKEHVIDCNLGDCPIDGGWAAWSDFPCSASCGPATMRRERTCTNPEPLNGGIMCQGPKEDLVDCNLADCSIDGGWSAWSDFSDCSASCGPATKTSERTCTDPEPSNGGIMCQGPKENVVDCNLTDCSIDRGWSAWSDFSACSASCGTATKRRERTCSDPEPSNGGIQCQGPKESVVDCNLADCPIDGGWSAWSDFSDCSAPCGPATKRRERTCSDPEPSNGGIMCKGPKENVVDCNLADCSIDGGWSAWSDFSACSASCGSATKGRERTCTDPEPSNGGIMCQGPKENVVDCNLADCPIDGGWSAWSDFSACSAPCGPATKRRERTCSDPEPSNGGIQCQGPSIDIFNCDLPNCGSADDGGWSSWSEYGSADDGGWSSWSEFGSAVDGGWTAWSEFGDCSATCGKATKKRVRTCTQPEPSYGGQVCQGSNEDVTYCSFDFC